MNVIKICPYCGKEISGNKKLCPNCKKQILKHKTTD